MRRKSPLHLLLQLVNCGTASGGETDRHTDRQTDETILRKRYPTRAKEMIIFVEGERESEKQNEQKDIESGEINNMEMKA